MNWLKRTLSSPSPNFLRFMLMSYKKMQPNHFEGIMDVIKEIPIRMNNGCDKFEKWNSQALADWKGYKAEKDANAKSKKL